MKELIERLEKATGPHRELDGAIALALGWTFQKMKGDQRAYYRKPGVTDYFLRSDPPEYTASLDAALTLVPEGWVTSHHQATPIRWHLYTERHEAEREGAAPPHKFCGIGTPAIATCIAALRARDHEGAQP